MTKTNRLDLAEHLLESAAAAVPERKIYAALADLALQRHDEAGWLKTWERYLTSSEDLGLDHASVCEGIARRFLEQKKPAEALPFAKRAAETFSGWGLAVYADALIDLHRYDEALRISLAEAERYGYWGRPYWLAKATGYGDAAAIARTYGPIAKNAASGGRVSPVIDWGLFLYLEGRQEEAHQVWCRPRSGNERPDRFLGALAALSMVESHQTNEAVRSLEPFLKLPAQNGREGAYHACLREMQRCLSNQTAVPNRQGDLKKVIDDSGLRIQRGNICYVIGRLAELEGHVEDAKWWYRTSLDTSERYFTCWALAAVALRTLGEDYFK